MLFAELGFSCMFRYCVEHLGLSEPAAGRRIAAARVCRRFPEAFGLVARGELHLSALCSLNKHLNPENAGELLGACRGKTKRQVEEWLVARFPKAEVRSEVRLEPLSEDRYGLHFTIDAEQLKQLELVRDLARHRLPDGDLSALFGLALGALQRELEKSRFGVGRAVRNTKRSAKATLLSPGESGTEQRKNSRYIPARVAREVYDRDGGCCTFVAEDGRRCGARGFVELDHVRPHAWGGLATTGNLRLLCSAHNQLRAQDSVRRRSGARAGPEMKESA